VAIKNALVANKKSSHFFHVSFKKFQILGNVANKNFGLAKALNGFGQPTRGENFGIFNMAEKGTGRGTQEGPAVQRLFTKL
jgi:hypothetical protein